MKDEYIDFLVSKGLHAVNTRMDYSTVVTSTGKILYVSENKPLNPAMATDFYQLTMCAAYLMSGKEKEKATFNMMYRKNPFKGSYGVFMGLSKIRKFLNEFQYTGEDIDFLRKAYVMPDILWEYLREVHFKGTCEAMQEGSISQPYLPLVQITDDLPIANLIETQLLTYSGYPTMVGTKSARITSQSPNPWLEFGLRGAPDPYSSLEASRAAYICGSSGTSNVAAHQIYGIPASGTMAHSFIMSFPTQLEAFLSYGRVFKEKSIFLIDTYTHIKGTKDAIEAAKLLNLPTFKGTRDDSGELAVKSIDIRKILDDNGYDKVKICVSSDIDEYKRYLLTKEENNIDSEGCGRRVVTMPDSGMVYKLVQIERNNEIDYTIKLSSDVDKMTDPGRKKVYRFMKDGYYSGDLITLSSEDEPSYYITASLRKDKNIRRRFNTNYSKLLTALDITNYKEPSVEEIKHFVSTEMKKLEPKMLDLENKEQYPLYLSAFAQNIKERLVMLHKG